MADKEKELAKREEEIKAKEDYISKMEAHLDEREKTLDEREKKLSATGPSVSPAGDTKKPLTKEQEKLIDEGCKAYGIAKQFLFHSRIDAHTGEAVLVTSGGAKVRYAKGMEVAKLDPVRVDGISRKKPKTLVMGKKK